jgi:hypothetical protein
MSVVWVVEPTDTNPDITSQDVSLILVDPFLFSVFTNLLLTNFFAPFLAARESNFSSCF